MFAEIYHSFLKKLAKFDETTTIRTNAEFSELWPVLQDGSHCADVQVGPVESEVGEVGKRLRGKLREAELGVLGPF